MKRVLVLLAACGTQAPAPAWDWQLPANFAAPPVPADNPMSADKVELGRRLFYDTRLSGNGTQACASCHAQAHAFTDGHATPLGSTGAVGRHNAMSIVNAGYTTTLTWAHLETSLEDQALVPMFGDAPVELGGDRDALPARLAGVPEYAELFPTAFPEAADPITVANVTRAIAAFERTIISGGSRFDRFVAGDATALTAAEQRGKTLFESPALGCQHCHGGFDLTAAATGEVFFDTGLYATYPATDAGLVEVTGEPADAGRFKPPTLRNIAVTAPYMHDGSVATLADALDNYARGGRLVANGPNAGDGRANANKSVFVTGFALAPGDRDDLIAFLGALTDDDLLANPALANPWQ
jgi:cytochrome c peroxidase